MKKTLNKSNVIDHKKQRHNRFFEQNKNKKRSLTFCPIVSLKNHLVMKKTRELQSNDRENLKLDLLIKMLSKILKKIYPQKCQDWMNVFGDETKH